MTSGDHFGELALINKEKRTLTVRCGSDQVKLLTLDRKTFTRILGQIEKFLNRDYSNMISFEKAEINTEWQERRINITGNLTNYNINESEYERKQWSENSEEIKEVLDNVNMFGKEDSFEGQKHQIQ